MDQAFDAVLNMNSVRVIWEDLRSSLWFIPGLLVLGAILLAVGLVDAESYVQHQQLVQRWPRLFGAGAEGARGMLSAIASSMITVTGVAFSITIVTFALASSQYTSRILRNFMGDRGNQSVLGVLLGVFAYCLVVLRTIRGGDEGVFVPSLAVLAAVLLALLAIGFLVFFIHHVADSIQASSIIQAVAEETGRAIDRLYPPLSRDAELGTEPILSGSQITDWVDIPARRTGYLQALDRKSLLRHARAHHTTIRMAGRVGDFVVEGTALAFRAGGQVEPELIRRVNAACTTGRHRTMQQDAAYGVRQIVDIALKALSPGINDTTTAIICIEYLGSVLVRLGGRQLPGESAEGDERGQVLLCERDYTAFVHEALDQIREHGAGNASVLRRLLEILAMVASRPQPSGRLNALREQGGAVVEVAERSLESPIERQRVEIAAERLSSLLGGAGDAQAS
jgi:uncharacterized membrane protein